jgi:hypothetical protein
LLPAERFRRSEIQCLERRNAALRNLKGHSGAYSPTKHSGGAALGSGPKTVNTNGAAPVQPEQEDPIVSQTSPLLAGRPAGKKLAGLSAADGGFDGFDYAADGSAPLGTGAGVAAGASPSVVAPSKASSTASAGATPSRVVVDSDSSSSAKKPQHSKAAAPPPVAAVKRKAEGLSLAGTKHKRTVSEAAAASETATGQFVAVGTLDAAAAAAVRAELKITKVKEVVRGKARQSLPSRECEQCRKVLNAS